MNRIKDLYFKDNKYYDYVIDGASCKRSRVGSTLKVWHNDGTFSIAYQYGEKYFTYDKEELMNQRTIDEQIRIDNKIRNEIFEKLNQLSTEELLKIANSFQDIIK